MELLTPDTAAAQPVRQVAAPRPKPAVAALKSLPRTRDVITGVEDLEHLFSFPGFPVYLGCTTAPPETDQRCDLSFAISKGSGCVQLDRLVPLDVLYAANHAPVVGEIWESHHREFARFVAAYQPRSVLEIGGAHGKLCSNVQQQLPDVAWTIVEPNPIPVPGLKARFIPAFFDSRFSSEDLYDMVVHSHTLEHLYEPRQFMADIARLARPGTLHCFSVPDLPAWLQRHYTNALNFEHSFLLSTDHVATLLADHGFRVLAQQAFGDRHSVFYATVKEPAGATAARPPAPAAASAPTAAHTIGNAYAANKALIEGYRSALLQQVDQINTALRTTPGRVFLFGAHVFSQTLLALGLDASRIECLLDNSAMKHGQRLYGTQLQVQSPAVLRGLQQPVVVMRAGAYEAEIKAGILRDHNPGTVFV